jgi:hypothetical protein
MTSPSEYNSRRRSKEGKERQYGTKRSYEGMNRLHGSFRGKEEFY